VHRAGKLPPIPRIEPADLLAAFGRDKKVIEDSLQWILLKAIGRPVIVSGKDIPKKILLRTIHETLRK
jgi:3-dehydroquinate synthetase